MRPYRRWTRTAAIGCAGMLATWAACTASGWAAAPEEAPSPQEAVILYGDAASFQNNGAFDLATEEWEKFLKKFPKDPLAPKAQHYLGVCHQQLKRYDKAAVAYEAVLKNFPKFDALQDVYLNLGWCQYSLAGQKVEGMYAKAAVTFADMAKKFPEGKYTDQALFFWGESEYTQGKKQEAVAPYSQLIQSFPQSPLRRDALYALGVTHEELGQFADAGKIYDLFLKEFPDHDLASEVTMRKAETILQAGDFAGAEKILAAVAAKEGFASVDRALSRQAFCLAKLNKHAEAGDLYAQLGTKFKDSTHAKEAALSAGRCYYLAERYPDATKWLQASADSGGESAPEAAHWLARIHLRNREPQKALAAAEKVLPKAAGSPFLVNLKMDQADALYEVADSRPKALEAYLKIVKDHPQHESAPQALYDAAFAAMELKQQAEALKHTQAFVKAYPQDRLLPDVKYVAAESQLQLNQFGEAEKAYRELVESAADRPESELWKVRLASAIYLQKKYEDVVKTLEPLVAGIKSPDNLAEVHFLAGVSQFQLDRFDAAAPSLQASLKANPKWRQADETLLFLSRVQRQQNKLPDAIATVRKMLAEFPNSPQVPQAHYRLGEYCYAANDYKTALVEYDAVIAQQASSVFTPYALYGKAWTQLKSKAFAEGAATLTTMIKDHAQHVLIPDARFARAMCRRQAGELEGAVEDVNAYLATKPELGNQCDALYERGLAQVALKKYADAAATFEELLKANPKYATADKVLYELAWAHKSLDDKAQAAAVATFGKLAASYPYSPLAAEANFHVGEAAYEKKEFAEAAKAYAACKAKAEKGDLAEKATYKLGWASFQQKQYDAALAAFTEQLETYPQGALRADGLFLKAESLFRQEKYTDALPAYQAAQATPPPSPTAQVLAWLHGAQSASQAKQWDVAIKLLTEIPEKFPDSAYLGEASYELGWAQQNSGKLEEAEQAYEEAATKSRTAAGARARFMIGELYFNKKQHPEAIRHFQRAMFGYGGDKAPDDVKKWQAKAGFEAGRCAEVQVKEAPPQTKPALVAEAKKYYQYVVEKHPQDEFAAQARQRLAELAKL